MTAEAPEESWRALWNWIQETTRRVITTAYLAGAFLALVYLHGRLNAVAERELAQAQPLHRITALIYNGGFVLVYVKLVYDMVDTFLPLGSFLRSLLGRWRRT